MGEEENRLPARSGQDTGQQLHQPVHGHRFYAETPEAPVTIDVVPRHATMYRVFDTELDRLGKAQNSVHLAFFTLCIGIAIGFGVTLLTVDILDPKKYAAFVALLVVFMLASIYFGIMFARDYQECKNEIARIRQGDKVE